MLLPIIAIDVYVIQCMEVVMNYMGGNPIFANQDGVERIVGLTMYLQY